MSTVAPEKPRATVPAARRPGEGRDPVPFPSYPKYKDSGVAWLGDIPAEWAMVRLKRACAIAPSNVDKKSYDGQVSVRLCNYTDVYYHDEITEQIEFMPATATDDQVAKFSLRAGDVLITKDSETPGDIAISAHVPKDLNGVICGYHLALLRPFANFSGGYLKYLFDSHYLRSTFAVAANGLTRYGLSQYAIDNADIPLLPRNEQEAIAAFLDRETAKIDALIAEQEKLIALLKEKRQALISHAVTKGLGPNAAMKDSGIEWLGQVPAHWTMKRLKHISPHITVGIVVNPSNYVANEGLPFIYGGDITEGSISTQTSRRISAEDSERNAKTRLHAGDVLTVRVGAPGVTAVAGPECEGGNCASVMLVRRGDFDSDWLCFAMNSRMVRYQVEIVQYGAAQEQFNISHAVNFWVATPPRAEQSRIAEAISTKVTGVDDLTREATGAIELLRERRSALTSAAVTGKICVLGP